jgi:zinc ribbon protein
MFGRKNSKIKFDARHPPREVLEAPQSFQYVHNFKVHFKRGVLQVLANKMDVSVNSTSPQLPPLQAVTDEFNRRMVMSDAHTNTSRRYDPSSFHITNIEYKESMGLAYSNVAITAPQAPELRTGSQSGYCRNCGNPIVPNSKFCNVCGARL